MEPFFLYILKCADDSYYIGHTDNLEKRLSEHYEGKASAYTAFRLPVQLVYNELFTTRDDAFRAERKLKKWTRLKKEILINKGWQALEGWKSKY
ncbi:hypothetical protein A3F66_04455 [candidate division TM6 bacterium RIFCSPHIGHO2_12_FULL_32_22]|nr:MAG: hypothetical protein A3F66_04455 [candidate division TM6 bacterium RIFCSPHIGHO2_12_FULL_32_22]